MDIPAMCAVKVGIVVLFVYGNTILWLIGAMSAIILILKINFSFIRNIQTVGYVVAE